jgi:hypothetical protein
VRAAVLFVCSLAIAGCGDDTSVAPEDAGADAPHPCDGTGVTKGPWVLAVSDTHASLRWETCRAGTSADVTLDPEADAGGAFVVHATETETDLTVQHVAALDPDATPDYAGAFFVHEAALSGLSPDTCYAYALAADATRTGRFCTAKPSGAPLRFVAIGDTNVGLGPTTSNILSYVTPMNPDMMLHAGDMEYYVSGMDTWQLWFDVMRPVLAEGPIYPAIGNHESETPDELNDYVMRFFHGAGFDGNDEYYTFENAGVRFFVLDTEEATDAASAQAGWFAQRITAAEQEPGYRMSIVFFHKPFVTCGDCGDNPLARQYFEPLFLLHKVPLVIQAHMHGYERFDFGNITYVTTAGGGGGIGDPDQNVSRSYCGQRVVSGGFFNALVVDVGATLKGTAVDDHGTVRDSFELTIP